MNGCCAYTLLLIVKKHTKKLEICNIENLLHGFISEKIGDSGDNNDGHYDGAGEMREEEYLKCLLKPIDITVSCNRRLKGSQPTREICYIENLKHCEPYSTIISCY